MRPLIGLVMATATAVSGCAGPGLPPPQVQAWLDAGGAPPPPQDTCPGVADMDLTRLAETQAAQLAANPELQASVLIQMPDAAEALVPADATHVVRVNLPPTGMYPNDLRAVAWKGADGVWMLWRQNRNFGEPPPMPPPPPPPEDSPYYAAWQAEFGGKPTVITEDMRWPPATGRMAPASAAALDAAFADPCRAWDPDYYPFVQPLRRPVDGWEDERICPPDGGYYGADITEPGRARRGVGAGCINTTPTFAIISTTAYAGVAAQ